MSSVDLLTQARRVAKRLARKNGYVTSTQVLSHLDVPEDVDKRFMGQVFGKSRGWRRVGFEKTGSHGRPVTVWSPA